MAKKAETVEELKKELAESQALNEVLADYAAKLENAPKVPSEKPVLTIGEKHYGIILPKFIVFGKTITAEELAGYPEKYATEVAYLLENKSEILKPL